MTFAFDAERPWCVACLTRRVEFPTSYFCPCCAEPGAPNQKSRTLRGVACIGPDCGADHSWSPLKGGNRGCPRSRPCNLRLPSRPPRIDGGGRNKEPSMKSRFGLTLAALAIFVSGCASPPQQAVQLDKATIGSKAGDVAVSRHVVEIKATLEKIRELVQNVE